jgi:hypothetical protein
VRVAQQLGLLANLPPVAVTTLIAFNAIHASVAVAITGAALLLGLNRPGTAGGDGTDGTTEDREP